MGGQGWVGGQKLSEVRPDRDRADAGAAAAVRDAERLVQVQVRHVGAERSGPGQPDQRVQVRPVHVHLAAGGVHLLAHLADGLLEHAVGGRVGQHDRRDVPGVRVQLGAQVAGVDGAVRAALDHGHAQPGEHRAGRVRAVGGLGDQAHVAPGLAAGGVVVPDREQPGELALRPGVGLQRYRVVSGDLGQGVLQPVDQLQVARGLLVRGERVQLGELRPADRLHLGGRVQLHRAGAQRDHRPVERDIEVGQPPQVPQHRGLAAVGVEHRVGQELAVPPQPGGQHVGSIGHEVAIAPGERRHHLPQLRLGRGLVAGDLHRVRPRRVQVVAGRAGPGRRLGGAAGHEHPDGVEEAVTARCESVVFERAGEDRRAPVHAARDRGQAARAVVGRVHRRDHRQQHLRRADVAGRLLPADVLLAGLQREPVRGVAVRVDRDADQPARQLALERVADADVARVRPAEAHRHAEPLGGADRDVRAELAGRCQQRQRQQVGGHRGQRAPGAGRLDRGRRVADRAAGSRVLQQHAEQLAVRLRGDQPRADLGGDQLDAQRLGPGGQHGQGLRQAVGVGQEDPALPGGPPGQGHGLGGRDRLVQHGRAGHRQPGQVLDHGLEVEQGLQAALGDLRLVRRVGGVPGRVLQHVAADHRGGHRAVVAQADHRGEHLILVSQAAQLGQRLVLGQGPGQAQRAVGQRGGQRGRSQLVERGVADGLEHLRLIVLGRPDVAVREVHGSLLAGSPGRAARRCFRSPPLLPRSRGSRAACPARSWCLRGSGEVAPSAPAAGCAGTLPGGVVSAHEPTRAGRLPQVTEAFHDQDSGPQRGAPPLTPSVHDHVDFCPHSGQNPT